MKRWRVLVGGALTALAISTSAFAAETDPSEGNVPEAPPLAALSAPNGWERAKHPTTSRDWVVHVAVRRLMTDSLGAGEGERLPEAAEGYRRAQFARAFILLSDALQSGSDDPLLLLDQGELYSLEDRNDEAAKTLAEVLEKRPDVPGAHRAWLTLAFAYAKTDHPAEEAVAYEKFLHEEEQDSGDYTIATLNLAEANMRLHHLPEAIEGYREVEINAGKSPTRTSVLAVWGLAIALDRLGDARGAAEQARLASQLDPEDKARLVRPVIGNRNEVFFVPDYERYWYLALGSTEDAKTSTNAHNAAFYWARAVTLWKAYLTPAENALHPEGWNAVAKAHLANAERQLKITSEKAKKEPKPAPPPPSPFIH